MRCSLILGRILGSGSCCGSQSQVLSTSFWRGLHFLRSQGPNPDFRRSGWSSWRAQRPIFQEYRLFSTSNLNFSLTHRGDWRKLAQPGLAWIRVSRNSFRNLLCCPFFRCAKFRAKFDMLTISLQLKFRAKVDSCQGRRKK